MNRITQQHPQTEGSARPSHPREADATLPHGVLKPQVPEALRTTRIVVADPRPLVRAGLQHVLVGPGLLVQGDTADAQGLLEACRRLTPDVVVMDPELPGGSGIGMIGALRAEFPGMAILVVTDLPAELYSVRAMSEGASAYLSKDEAVDQLVPALRMAITGRKYVTPGVAALLAEHLDGTSRGLPHESLSRREFEVMQKLGAGHRVCDIAQQLGLSMKTVSTFRARMMRKLGMETHADLVRYLVQHDLLT